MMQFEFGQLRLKGWFSHDRPDRFDRRFHFKK